MQAVLFLLIFEFQQLDTFPIVYEIPLIPLTDTMIMLEVEFSMTRSVSLRFRNSLSSSLSIFRA